MTQKIILIGGVWLGEFAAPIHIPSIAILACDNLGLDTERVDLNKRGKRFLCDVDGVVDQGELAMRDQKVFFSDPSENLIFAVLGP